MGPQTQIDHNEMIPWYLVVTVGLDAITVTASDNGITVRGVKTVPDEIFKFGTLIYIRSDLIWWLATSELRKQ